MSFLTLNNVSYRYRDADRCAVENLSFSMHEGEFLAIIGHNGSGKSTMAKLINGLYTPCSGEVTYKGISTREAKRLHDIRKEVGVVFQNPDNQMVATIVEDDVAFGPENVGVPHEEIEERVTDALAACGMLSERKTAAARLSGGQKQRVAIAGVLALRPRLMIFDESTAMLDPKGRKEVLSVIGKLNREQGIAVILITHYMEEAAAADRILVMHEGHLVADGTPSAIFQNRELLARVGVTTTPTALLCDSLTERGITLPQGILYEEELTEALWRQLK
ncbi:MAG: energy-coupling factor transporter ATPase [Clostridia bacterium]|nr:energy-coupling factor transporter ATPase [Clostridia bacterium]